MIRRGDTVKTLTPVRVSRHTLKAGTRGTVWHIDDYGIVHMDFVRPSGNTLWGSLPIADVQKVR